MQRHNSEDDEGEERRRRCRHRLEGDDASTFIRPSLSSSCRPPIHHNRSGQKGGLSSSLTRKEFFFKTMNVALSTLLLMLPSSTSSPHPPPRAEAAEGVVSAAIVPLARNEEEKNWKNDVNENFYEDAVEVLTIPLKSLPNSGCWAVSIILSSSSSSLRHRDTSDDNDDGSNGNILESSYEYLAVVDTGSPFLTAPKVIPPPPPLSLKDDDSGLQPRRIQLHQLQQPLQEFSWMKPNAVVASIMDSVQSRSKQPSKTSSVLSSPPSPSSSIRTTSPISSSATTTEQYGQTVGEMLWVGSGRTGDHISHSKKSIDDAAVKVGRKEPVLDDRDVVITATMLTTDGQVYDFDHIIFGVPSFDVQEETGGLFAGLMIDDDNSNIHPTFLQQLALPPLMSSGGKKERMKSATAAADDDDNNTVTGFELNFGKQRPVLKLYFQNRRNENMRPLSSDNIRRSVLSKSPPSSSASLSSTIKYVTLPIFELSPTYGPNLHHYATLCHSLDVELLLTVLTSKEKTDSSVSPVSETEFRNIKINIHSTSPSLSLLDSTSSFLDTQKHQKYASTRPIVAVIDTGLSGCIFSDTLWETIQKNIAHDVNTCDQKNSSSDGLTNVVDIIDILPTGCDVTFHTGEDKYGADPGNSSSHFKKKSLTSLRSDPAYWRFQSFRLPWWWEDITDLIDSQSPPWQPPPHVIVLGSAFWRNSFVQSLAIDIADKQIKIGLVR